MKNRYSGGLWTELQTDAADVKSAYERGGLAPDEVHRLSDRLREIAGAAQATGRLVPRIEAEHRRAIEWAVDRVAIAVRRASRQPWIEEDQRNALDVRLRAVVQRIDAGELDTGEVELRELEAFVEEMESRGAAAEFDALFAGLDQLYVRVQ
jgi:glutathione S-transferase